MKSRSLLSALLILSLSGCAAKAVRPSTEPLINQCPATALSSPPLPALLPASTRADNVAADDIKDTASWEQALLILRAAQDCLRTLEKEGVLRVVPSPKKPSK